MLKSYKIALAIVFFFIVASTVSFTFVALVASILLLISYDFNGSTILEIVGQKFSDFYSNLFSSGDSSRHRCRKYQKGFFPEMDRYKLSRNNFNSLNDKSEYYSPIYNSNVLPKYGHRQFIQATSTPLFGSPFSTPTFNRQRRPLIRITPKPQFKERVANGVSKTPPKLNISTYADSRSYGLTNRIVDYNEEAEEQSRSPNNLGSRALGSFPIVHLFKKDPPVISPKPNKVMIHLAQPDLPNYDREHRRLLLQGIIQDNPAKSEQNEGTRSVLDALREISRKRIHSDEGSDIQGEEDSPKRRNKDVSTYDSENNKSTRDTSSSNRTSVSASPELKPRCVIDEITASLSSSIRLRKRKAKVIEKENEKENKQIKLHNVETQTTDDLLEDKLKGKNTPSGDGPAVESEDKQEELTEVEKRRPLKIFDDKPLEIQRKKRLTALLSAIAKCPVEFEQIDDSPGIVSILSPPNKPKNDEKHVTFNENVEVRFSEKELSSEQQVTDLNHNTSLLRTTSSAATFTTSGGFFLGTPEQAALQETQKSIQFGGVENITTTTSDVEKKKVGGFAFDLQSNSAANKSANQSITLLFSAADASTNSTSSFSSANTCEMSASSKPKFQLSGSGAAFTIAPSNSPFSLSETKTDFGISGNIKSVSGFNVPIPLTSMASGITNTTSTAAAFGGFSSTCVSNGNSSSSGDKPFAAPVTSVPATFGGGFGSATNHADFQNTPFTFGAPSTVMNNSGSPFCNTKTTSAFATPAFGGISTSALGTTETTQAFGGMATTQTFGATGTTQGFGSTNNTQAFGSKDTSQPFGVTSTGATQAFGVTSTGATQAFGGIATTQTFGTTGPTQGFGSTSNTQAFGNKGTSQAFGVTSTGATQAFAGTTQVFGNTGTTPVFGKTTNMPTFGGSTAASAFGGTTPFGATTTTPFGATATASPFGATTTTSPFGTTTTSPFGATTTTSPFGTTTTTSPFGTITTNSPFRATTTSPFGATTTTSPFGATTTTSPFGATTTTSPFGTASKTPAFGASTTTPTFGATTAAPVFGGTTTPAFGNATTTPAFGNTTTTPAFGATTTPAFGASNTPAFGSAVSNTRFGTASTTSIFGSTTTPAFGNTPVTSAFGNTNTAFGSSTFGRVSAGSVFGTTTSAPVFGSSAPAFGGTNTSGSLFVNTPTSQPFGTFGGVSAPAFGTPTTTPAFGAAPSFGSNTTTPSFGNAFGVATTTAIPSFGTANTTTASAFSSAPTNFSFGSNFGNAPFGAIPKSETSSAFSTPFGAPSTTSSFGTAPAQQSTFSFGSNQSSGVFSFGAAGDANKQPGTNFSSSGFPSAPFNAPSFNAPPTGMFSIGSGGSTPKPRSQVRARRRM